MNGIHSHLPEIGEHGDGLEEGGAVPAGVTTGVGTGPLVHAAAISSTASNVARMSPSTLARPYCDPGALIMLTGQCRRQEPNGSTGAEAP